MRKRLGIGRIVGVIIAASVPATAQGAKPATAFAYSEGGDGRFELTLSGKGVPSRDAVEGDLLRRAALLARSRGNAWFVLRHMGGEQPGQHRARTDATFGERYGHWQPHWSYKLAGTVWQPWHPEWGTAFWTNDVPAAMIQSFEVHAMIDVGNGPLPAQETAFDANQVIRDLSPGEKKRQ